MAAVAIWESELKKIETGFKKVKEKEKLPVKKKIGPLSK